MLHVILLNFIRSDYRVNGSRQFYIVSGKRFLDLNSVKRIDYSVPLVANSYKRAKYNYTHATSILFAVSIFYRTALIGTDKNALPVSVLDSPNVYEMKFKINIGKILERLLWYPLFSLVLSNFNSICLFPLRKISFSITLSL